MKNKNVGLFCSLDKSDFIKMDKLFYAKMRNSKGEVMVITFHFRKTHKIHFTVHVKGKKFIDIDGKIIRDYMSNKFIRILFESVRGALVDRWIDVGKDKKLATFVSFVAVKDKRIKWTYEYHYKYKEMEDDEWIFYPRNIPESIRNRSTKTRDKTLECLYKSNISKKALSIIFNRSEYTIRNIIRKINLEEENMKNNGHSSVLKKLNEIEFVKMDDYCYVHLHKKDADKFFFHSRKTHAVHETVKVMDNGMFMEGKEIVDRDNSPLVDYLFETKRGMLVGRWKSKSDCRVGLFAKLSENETKRGWKYKYIYRIVKGYRYADVPLKFRNEKRRNKKLNKLYEEEIPIKILSHVFDLNRNEIHEIVNN